MYHHHRIALLGAAAATLAVPAAHAQQATPTPTPVPRSSTIFSPAIGNFSLRPSGEQSQPQPQPTLPVRVAAPTPAPSPAPRATATPTRPVAQPIVRPTGPQPEAVRVTPTPTPSAAATPLPVPQTNTTPAAAPSPAATIPATVTTPVPAQPGEAGLPWLWMLLGAVLATAIAAGGWLLGRRSRPVPRTETQAPAVERPTPAPVPDSAPPPPPAARLVPAAPVEPIAIEFHPLGIQVGDKGVELEFEMGLLNASGASADGLRVSLLLASANPDQNALIANFHAASGLPAAGPPVDLPAGEGGRIPGKLAIEAERIHVVQVGGRAMFVPIVLIDLRWRGGLSVRRHGADFMIGTAGQGAGQGGKLGPIWLDRGAQRVGGLAASRYVPQARPVAA